jgi:hypothetical protein
MASTEFAGITKRLMNKTALLNAAAWTEEVLYMKNSISFDVPYIMLGAFIHGGLTFMLVSPFAVQGPDRSTWTPDGSMSEMCGSAILIFFIAAVIVRLLAEPEALNCEKINIINI